MLRVDASIALPRGMIPFRYSEWRLCTVVLPYRIQEKYKAGLLFRLNSPGLVPAHNPEILFVSIPLQTDAVGLIAPHSLAMCRVFSLHVSRDLSLAIDIYTSLKGGLTTHS